MRVYIQWARSAAVDWQPVDIRRPQDWRGLPDKVIPTARDEPVDERPGWINALNCQGVVFSGFDHYAVDGDGTNVEITGWQDSADFPPGQRYAVTYTFRPLAPDERIGGQLNTRQSVTLYAEPTAELPTGQLATARPWDEFVAPPANMQRHGKWLTDDEFRAHMRAFTPRGWREWA